MTQIHHGAGQLLACPHLFGPSTPLTWPLNMHVHAAVRWWVGGGSGSHTFLSQLHISPPMFAAVLPSGLPSTSTYTDASSSSDGTSRPYEVAPVLVRRPVCVATHRVAKHPLLGCFNSSDVCGTAHHAGTGSRR